MSIPREACLNLCHRREEEKKRRKKQTLGWDPINYADDNNRRETGKRNTGKTAVVYIKRTKRWICMGKGFSNRIKRSRHWRRREEQ